MMAQLWPSCHVKWIRRPSNLGLMLKIRTRRFLHRLIKLFVLRNSESCSCSRFVLSLRSLADEDALMCRESSRLCSRPQGWTRPCHPWWGQEEHQQGPTSHLVASTMGSDLIRVEYHRQAQVAMVAGSNLLDMLLRYGQVAWNSECTLPRTCTSFVLVVNNWVLRPWFITYR